MSYLALYRKYRPTDFEGLIGQDHIVKTLVNQIKTDRIGHAYLFTGTRGTGKTSLAKIFARAINCTNSVNGSPCGQCEACKALQDPSNVDVVEIDAASNNGVNEIRDLREKVQYPPVSCKYKVYIIDEVHMLSGVAFNALLKTLEEPPKHAIFILATTEVHKIPATILSRCMRFDFKLIPTEVIAKHIEDIFDEQGKEYEKEAVFAIAKAGEGSIRDALSIADIAISYSTEKLTYSQVMEILGSSNEELLYDFIKNLLEGNSGKVLEKTDDICKLGKSMNVLTKDLTEIIRSLLVVKCCSNPNDILGLPVTKFNALTDIASIAGEERLLRVAEILSGVENDLKYTTHPRVVFETAILKAVKPELDYDFDAMMARLKDLEDKINSGNFSVSKPVCEKVAEEKPIKKEVIELNADRIKGKLLLNLRNNGCEMLWNFIQSVEVAFENGIFTIFVDTDDDKDLLLKSKERLDEALQEFSDIQVKIEAQKTNKAISEIEDATEKIKKIFGEDIVIVKN